MPLTKEEKDQIVNKVVEILKSPDKEQLITALREKVFKDNSENADSGEETSDEVVYSVIQAINELYG
jgi:hypothetical protein